ncbi:MAG: hypothetical protein IKJ78_06030 [Bacteroidales bacterium]|nr:hypothetical protein [Bacteroidales bacterium]
MREILFRGKRVDNKEWVYGDLIHTRGGYPLICARHDFGSAVDGVEVDYNTLCQYTGMIDKNGNKIFEGDILAVEKINGNIKKRVRYDVELGMWKADRTEGSTQDFELYVYADLGCVIGNIHDNPELLKGGKE